MAANDAFGTAAAASDRETSVTQGDRLEVRTWLRLLTCANMIERMVRHRLRATFDITLPRFDILAQLDRAPDGLTMGALSRRLMVTNGNVTGLVERLVVEGLVERRAAPGDRRTQVVRLTGEGRRAFGAMAPVHRQWVREAMGAVDRDDLATLHGLLAGLKESVANTAGAARPGP